MTRDINNVKKIIGFDLDGVIVDHSGAKIKLANSAGFKIKQEETPSDIFRKILPKDKFLKIQTILYGQMSDQLLFEGAKDTLEQLQKRQIPIYLISRRRPGAAREMAVQIMKNRGLWPSIFNNSNVVFVETKEEKNYAARRLKVTHYLDDEEDVLKTMNIVPNRFLFDPFDTNKNTSFKEIRNWKEFSEAIY